MVPIHKQTKLCMEPGSETHLPVYMLPYILFDALKSTCGILIKNKYTRILFREKHILFNINHFDLHFMCDMHVCLSNLFSEHNKSGYISTGI